MTLCKYCGQDVNGSHCGAPIADSIQTAAERWSGRFEEAGERMRIEYGEPSRPIDAIKSVGQKYIDGYRKGVTE